MLVFLISALRAIVEMLGLCLIGQSMLYLMAGRQRASNPIYQFLALVTRGPRKFTAYLLPAGCSSHLIGMICLLILFFAWIGLALLRKFY